MQGIEKRLTKLEKRTKPKGEPELLWANSRGEVAELEKKARQEGRNIMIVHWKFKEDD